MGFEDYGRGVRETLLSVEKSAGLPLSEDLQNRALSVPSERKDLNSLALEASQISNGDYDASDLSQEDFPPSPSNHQSILVSFSSSCLRKGTICERGRFFRIKYYGTFDKPLGRFLRDTLFDLNQECPACGESKDSHVVCYTHRQGCLTISVHKQSQSLDGESEGKIWMWHRCLRCNQVDGIPPATRPLVMSDAAWSLSLGKFLKLSFSNHAATRRVASCGHSLHRDCLRFYGFGNMTACIRYSPVNVYSVYLPISKLDFHCAEHQEWLRQEIREIAEKGDHLFKDIFNRLQHVHDKITSIDGKSQDAMSHILDLKDILTKQEDSFKRALRGADQPHADILQLNYIRHCLSNCSSLWDTQIQSLSCSAEGHFSAFMDILATFDAAWTGEGQTWDDMPSIEIEAGTSDEASLEHRMASTLTSPAKAGKPSNIEGWVGAPYLSFSRCYNDGGSSTSCSPPKAAQLLLPLLVASYTEQAGTQEGVTVSLSPGVDEPVICVYDDEPTSVIAYAITSQEYQVHLFEKSDKQRDKEKDFKEQDREKMFPFSSGIEKFHPFQPPVDGRSEQGNAKESNTSSSYESLPDKPLLDSKAFHVKVNFTDDTPQGKIKYAVTCYYAKQFDCLRKRYCQNELDFIRSLCRCKKWGAQGGKSNVFFAKTVDDRFVVKQVTRTELDSFIKFAPTYFKHISDALITGSPTCLAKILGIYQVTVKHVKGGKESHMDLMIMENLLYGRKVTRVYDLKGSLRSRYNPYATAKDAVLLDQNLLESLQSSPIFISNKAKRLLERAIWNDTAFLASVDVINYSLLIGVDEERGELVLGIIDFMRQYTWDKRLETWIKASGILGGPKNMTPTVISPTQYKKRFRKAMRTYFLMVPDHDDIDDIDDSFLADIDNIDFISSLPYHDDINEILSLPYHDDIDDSFLAAMGDLSSLDYDTGRVQYIKLSSWE